VYVGVGRRELGNTVPIVADIEEKYDAISPADSAEAVSLLRG